MIFIKNKNRNSKNGSIALISLLIISAVTLLLVLGMSDANISTAYQNLNAQANKYIYYAAESCAEEAMLRLEDDASFTGTTVNLDEDTSCTISVTDMGATLDVDIQVTYLTYTQNYSATADLETIGEVRNLGLQSWSKN